MNSDSQKDTSSSVLQGKHQNSFDTELRKHGLNRYRVGQVTGISPCTLGLWAKGKGRPTIENAILVCILMKISLRTFAEITGHDVSELPLDAPPQTLAEFIQYAHYLGCSLDEAAERLGLLV